MSVETTPPDVVIQTAGIGTESGVDVSPWLLPYPAHAPTCVRQVQLSALCSCGIG